MCAINCKKLEWSCGHIFQSEVQDKRDGKQHDELLNLQPQSPNSLTSSPTWTHSLSSSLGSASTTQPCVFLSQPFQKAMNRLVAISYCSNPSDRCAVDKPSVKAVRRPDWRPSWAPAELRILDHHLVLHEFTAVLADKEGFCSVAFLILKGLPNLVLFRRKGFYSRGQTRALFLKFRKCLLERPKLSFKLDKIYLLLNLNVS